MSDWAKLHHAARTRIDRRVADRHGFNLFCLIKEECESEIERMLACQLADLFCPDNYTDTVVFSPNTLCEFYGVGRLTFDIAKKHYDEWHKDTDCLWSYGPRMRCAVYPQVKLWHIRVDFLIIASDWDFRTSGERHDAIVVVECDGHDFHERTKEQAARDRRRDRLLTTANIPFLRFTGSEIYRDSMACLFEIENLLWKQLNPRSPSDTYPPRKDDQEFQSAFADEADQ